MKYLNTAVRRTMSMLVGATIASLCFVTLADTGSVGKNIIGKTVGAVAIQNTFQPSGKPSTTSASPLSLLIESPAGEALRLTYVADQGWAFADSISGHKTANSGLNLTAMPRPEKKHALNGPQTVFIDGPTGYTFMWSPDTGWKFIGRIAEPKP
jgi:hypothetical protein